MIKRLQNILAQKELKEIISQGGLSLISRTFSFFIAYVFFIYLTKVYSEEVVGLFQLSNSIIIICVLITSIGFQKSVVRFSSRLIHEENYLQLHKVILSFMRIILPLSIICGIAIFYFSDLLASSFFSDERMSTCLKLVGIILPFYTIFWILTEFYRGINKFKISETMKFVGLWVPTIVFCYALTQLFNESFIPLAAYCISIVMLCIFGVPYAFKKVKTFKTKGNKGEIENFNMPYYFKTSLPMIVTSLSLILLIRIDFIMLGGFDNVSMDEIGVYGIAAKIGVLTNFANQALQRITAPKISKFFWANDLTQLKKLIFNVKRVNLIVSLPICLMVLIFTKQLLGIFGEEYASGVFVTRIIAIAYFLNAYFGLSGIFMNMTGNQKEFMYVMLMTIVLNFVLNLILIPKMGINGPAISTCICFVFWNLITTVFIYRKYKVKMYYIPFISKV